ncbi:MAG TPA: ATP-binding protein [Anaerolineales bacterium]|nr:ATP-binding protein [Anaerolineales bacterium]
MSLFLGQILTLITTSPGNLVYHLVLVFAIGGTLQWAIQFMRSSQFPQARRMVIGLGILLGLQMIMFVISGLVWQGLVSSTSVLPPLDRAVSMITLVWIAWIWAFPEPVRMADAATLLLSLLGITVFGVMLAFWTYSSTNSFNLSIYEVIWQVLSVGIALLGITALFLRKPNGWENGAVMLGLAFFGHLLSLFVQMEGDFPGFVRLAHLAMFPMLLTLAQRFPAPAATRTAVTPVTVAPGAAPAKSKTQTPAEPIQERRRYSTDPKTFHALMTLASESEGARIGQALTRSIAQAMLADLCFLLTLGEDKSLSISYGYDLIREENLGGTTIDPESIPLLATALQRGRPLRLPSSSTSSDLKGLGQILGLSTPGHLLSIPITTNDQKPIGGVMILSPYSNRLWSAEDQAYLSNVAPLFVPILERSKQSAQLQAERDQSIAEARGMEEKLAEVKKKYEQAAADLDSLREKGAQSGLQAENMAALLVMQEEAQKGLEQLKAENEQLRSMSGSAAVNEQMERELRQTLEEMARMQNQLAEANIKILELEKRPTAPITAEQVEVIASISQELRQPMSSIVGYTDLLMGESVGILGALQRKFIERIKASTERIGGLVDDLIQITNLETGKLEFKAEPIDLNLIIDNAMAYTSTQIREKNITLRLDIPETAPRIQTDRDALQQVLIHLLQNATGATHSEGNITLRVQIQKEGQNNFLFVQVTDSGGGIPADDIPRVFARRYRAENSLIEGLGDTGVGLSIARTLVEAQNGRIWVETNTGEGSTFSVLMPVLVEEPEEQ